MSFFKPIAYEKDSSGDPIFRQVNRSFLIRSRILPIVLPSLGVLLFVSQVLIPLFFFTTQDEITDPISSSALGRVTGFHNFKFTELEDKKSRVLGTTYEGENAVPDYFKISIPRLNIKNALVETNAYSLQPDSAIGHYPNSALPGDVGNTFLFGHSVLPFFYNPRNYKTIFSTIDRLQAGDLIYVKYKNKMLTYKVDGKRELKPNQVDPLAEVKPKFLNESTMVLMTCSPMGTKINRYLVDTILIESLEI